MCRRGNSVMRNCVKSIAGTIVASLTAALCSSTTLAQVHTSGYALPLSLALEAAAEALKSCDANGYPVTVAVVDTSGEMRVLLKGDRSTAHTSETAFRKAYTLATLGPIFGYETLGPFAETMRTNPFQASFLTVPNIILLPGAAAVSAKGEIVAAIGVGGAPGGEKDE